MENLRILFFSDAHFRLEKNHARKEVLEHIANHCSSQHPDIVIFTGDLAQSAKDEEYAEALSAWQELKTACPSAKFVWVPGNHDLGRADLPMCKSFVHNISSREEIDALLDPVGKNPDCVHLREQLTQRFSTWQKNAATFGCEGLGELGLWSLQGGSFRLVTNGWDVAVSLVNSAFTAFGDDDQGHLLVSRGLARELVKKTEGADLRIALSHHPSSWWHNDCRDNWDALEQGHDLFLTGHEHRGKIGTSAATSDGGKCHFVAAGASDESANGGGNQIFFIECSKSNGDLSFRAQKLRVSLENTGGVAPYPDRLTDERGFFPKNGEFEILRASVSRPAQKSLLPSEPTPEENLDFPMAFLRHLSQELDVEIFSHHSETHPDSAQFSLYWPVRLRPPNIVHAVQTFIAAALCKRGVAVHLCFDDLGSVDGYPNREVGLKLFRRQVKAWASKVTDATVANHLLSNSLSFHQYLSGGVSSDQHDQTMKQLGSNLVNWLVAREKLQTVLLESKLLTENDDDLNSALLRRPRRLLTPPVVWTVLQLLHAQNKDKPMLTLGGVDEKPIWQAFEAVDNGSISLTSVLIPRVSTKSNNASTTTHEVAMDSGLLKICSKAEALAAINPDIEDRKSWFVKFAWHLPELVNNEKSMSLQDKLNRPSEEIASKIVLM